MKHRINLPIISAAAVILMIALLLLTTSEGLLGAGTGEEDGAVTPNQRTYTLEELQEDFEYVRSVVEKKHPLFFADEQKVEAVFDQQYALLTDGMSALEFYRVLSPAIAALNCGHSNLLLSPAHEQYIKRKTTLLPLKVTVLEQKLYVVESKYQEYIQPGAEIMSINGVSAREMLETIYSSISSDGGNRTRIDKVIENQFPFLYHTLIDESETFTVRYRLPATPGPGQPEELRSSTLPGVGFSELWGSNHAVASIGVLLDMAELKTDYAARILNNYAVLSLGSFILKQRDFSTFLEDFFHELEEKRIEKLVIDLRGNWGGTPQPAALLLAYLSSEPLRYFNSEAPFYMFKYKRLREPKKPAFAGTVYVLMDGSCFSTTAHFITLLKHNKNAILIGEEAGGSAACTDGKRKIVLPNTGMRVYYSTRVCTTAVEDFTPGKGIQPDYRIQPTAQDVASGRDPVAEYAAHLIAE